MPDLRKAQGDPTGALYAVVNMLRKLVSDYKADYAACIFDARGKTFRDDLYPDYQSHRPPMPEDLAAQLDHLHQAVRALGWPVDRQSAGWGTRGRVGVTYGVSRLITKQKAG